jgi:hypothetical protein
MSAFIENILVICLLISASSQRALSDSVSVDERGANLVLQQFHECVAEPSRLDLMCAFSSLEELDDSLINVSFKGETPVLHHLMNLYVLTMDHGARHGIKQLMVALLGRGVDVNDGGPPHILTKAIMMREMMLAKDIGRAGAIMTDAQEFTSLFSTPCNPSSVAKMLLHADTLLRERGLDHLTPSELLHSASLHPGATPALRSVDLELGSSTFRRLLGQVGNKTAGPMFLRLADLIGSADDLTKPVFHEVLSNYVSIAGMELAQVWLAHVLASPPGGAAGARGRNMLQMIAISGLTETLKLISDFMSSAQGDAKEILVRALLSTDTRGNSALDYAATRFGESHHYELVSALYSRHIDIEHFDTKAKERLESHRASTVPAPELTAADRSLAREYEGRGGWGTLRLDESVGGDGRCDILQVNDMPKDPAVFFRDYIAMGKPVVFRGAVWRNPGLFRIATTFEKNNFVAKYGADLVNIASIPYAGSFGVSGISVNISQIADNDGSYLLKSSTFAEVLPSSGESQGASSAGAEVSALSPPQNVPLYAFTTGMRQSIKEDAPPPVFLSGLAQDAELQFYLGPPGTGAPLHFHGHAVNTLAYGEKVGYTSGS